ncbi:MAG: ABC transporter permease [Deltaproteobacteria bacterium]|nr:ABC transporter permease [Deltaproteobacteria bacterium]
MKTLFLIAARNLLANRRRSLLLGGAIATVTAILVLLSSLSNGMSETMLRVATTLSTGHLNVGGFYKMTTTDASPMITEVPKILEAVKGLGDEVSGVVVRGRGWGKLVSDHGKQEGVLVGIDVATESSFREVVTLTDGSFDALQEPGSCLIFAGTAERLEVKAGDDLTLTAPTLRGAQNTADCRVAAIAKDMGMLSSFSMFVHHDTLRSLYQMKPDQSGAVHIFLRDPAKAEDLAAKLRTALAGSGFRIMDPVPEPFFRKFQSVAREDWSGQKLDVTTWSDEMAFMRYTLQTFSLLTVVFVTILLGIIILGVMNTLMMSIRERTREIGTLRAIGMHRPSVLVMFVFEAFLLSLGATVAGSLAGSALVLALDAAKLPVSKGFQMFLMSDTLHLQVDVQTAVIAVVSIATVTTISSLLPSWRAARKPPVTAMQAN